MAKSSSVLRVRFPGMPAERFCEFEDSIVDLGAISAAPEDVGWLLTIASTGIKA